MSNPVGCRDHRIEFGRLSFDQKEAVQVAAVRIEKHDLESLNRALLLQSTQILDELVEMPRTRLFPAWNRPVPPKQNDARAHHDPPCLWIALHTAALPGRLVRRRVEGLS